MYSTHHSTPYLFLVYLASPKDNQANFAGLTSRSAGPKLPAAPRDFGGKHSEALFTALVAGLATYAMLLGPEVDGRNPPVENGG